MATMKVVLALAVAIALAEAGGYGGHRRWRGKGYRGGFGGRGRGGYGKGGHGGYGKYLISALYWHLKQTRHIKI